MPDLPDTKPQAVKSDVQYISCQTCKAMVNQAYKVAQGMREQLAGAQKLDESALLDKLETMCDYESPNGKWITEYDLVEEGVALKLDWKAKVSKCNVECATMSRACSQIIDDFDLTELSEALYAGKDKRGLRSQFCTDRCQKKPPPLPEDRAPGPAHVPMTEEQQKMDEMMAKMKASGLGGKLYDKDALKAQMEALQEQADDGDFGEVHLKEQEQQQQQQQGAGGTGEQLLQQAKETATSVVNKVKGLWGRLAGGGSAQAGEGEL